MNTFPRRIVLVTGANGFLGRPVCAALEAQGHEVRRIVRQAQTSAQTALSSWTVTDLAEQDIPDAAFEGVDVVIHLAANVLGRDHDPEGTKTAEMARRVAAQTCKHKVARVILLSSIAVRLLEQDGAPPREYSVQKRDAERAFREGLGGANKTVILRPPVIYGAGARGSFGFLVALVRRGIPLPVKNLSAPRSYLSRSNLNALLCHLVTARDAQWEAANKIAFEPHDESAVSTADLVSMVAQALGKTPRLFSAPKTLVTLAGKWAGKAEQIEAIYAPLMCQRDPSLVDFFDWTPHVKMPKSLAFLENG